MNSGGRSRRVGMRSHDTNNTTSGRIQTSSNDTQDDVLAGEDTGNPWDVSNSGGSLHYTNRRCPAFSHEFRNLFHGRFGSDSRRLSPRVHDSRQIWQRSLLAQRVNIRKHGRCLWVRRHTTPKLILNAGQRSV